jgi:ABC-2 type transport system ATP-binding protein
MLAVETSHLTKTYPKGKITALNELDLKIEQGQIFSVLGANGAGKTTFIKLLLGIIFPTKGSAKILNKSISDYHTHQKIGYLAENHRFPDFLSAFDVLYYYGKMGGIKDNTLKTRIPMLLEKVKLGKWENIKIKKFSKGMLQRLGIAQALINDPEILFLDEPTDGIDPIGRREVRDLLKNLKNEGKTIILNSHLLSEVELISDKAAILKKGRLVKLGAIHDFISIKEQFELKCTDPKQQFENICKSQQIEFRKEEGGFIVFLENDIVLNHLIDKLRASQIAIQAIIPKKMSLEDFFIDIVENKDIH